MGQLPRYYINKCNAIKHDKIRVMKLRTSYQSNERTAPHRTAQAWYQVPAVCIRKEYKQTPNACKQFAF